MLVIVNRPLLTVREQHASISRGAIVDGGVANLIIVAPRAESGAMARRIVGYWRETVPQQGRELADDLELVNATTPHLPLLSYPLTRGVGLTGLNKVVTYLYIFAVYVAKKVVSSRGVLVLFNILVTQLHCISSKNKKKNYLIAIFILSSNGLNSP